MRRELWRIPFERVPKVQGFLKAESLRQKDRRCRTLRGFPESLDFQAIFLLKRSLPVSVCIKPERKRHREKGSVADKKQPRAIIKDRRKPGEAAPERKGSYESN